MPPALIAPLAAFLLLALLAALVVRRVFGTAGNWRADVEFRGRMRDIAGHAEAVLSNVLPPADEVRRHRAEAETIVPLLEAASGEIAISVDEASSMHGTGPDEEVRVGLVADLERAARAVELLQHGCGVLETTRDGRRGEGEVAIKRGYLNLLHAREELRTRGREAQTTVELKFPIWRRRAS